MLFRFSLYGFLKNQRYFEPFIILFFLDAGLSFTLIGVLVAIREFATNLMEIPSGALADLYGRRRVMIVSFLSYLISFGLFATGESFPQFALAMVLYAGGDAFRTGTHKAMIFTWLRRENRLDEKTKVYGITRSWSKMGAAISLVPATACVFWLRDYSYVFWFAMIPYCLGIINFLLYPAWLDGPRQKASVKEVFGHLRETAHLILAESHLRRLILESMTYEGMFKAGKDYLQPVVKQAALALPFLVALETESRTALLIGAVYFVVNLVSAFGSRRSHRVVEKYGGEEPGVLVVWRLSFLAYLVLIPLLYLGWEMVAVGAFLLLFLLQNLFRPMQISRFDAYSDETRGATVLSVESQAKTLATMVIAPVLGAAVDGLGAGGAAAFWPVGLFGVLLAGVMLLTAGKPGVPRD
ncbi:MAG: MFS transporter [Candidatus Krumholzibacteriota bacterium]